jgi:nitroimidazol reductase NimA-like FMN-containing flavoprotein (pyridoxamine 5'-phosphate oxidase superfamily)
MKVLDDEQCVALLQSARFGRVALTVRAMPIIVPVHFMMLGNDPVFPIGSASIARATDRDEVVCFQADWVAPDGDDAWSVAIVGRLALLTAPEDLQAATAHDFGSWSTANPQFARVISGEISGRSRVTAASASAGH